MTEIYSLSGDFTGLTNHQLKSEIIASAITPVCTDVKTDDDVVSIMFDSEIDAGDKTTLDGLVAAHVPIANSTSFVATGFKLDDITTAFEKYTKASFTLTKNVKTQLPGTWVLASGSMGGFSTTTGVWTCPMNGIYSYTLLISTAGANTNPDIHIEMQDEADAFVFGTTNGLSIVHNPTHTFVSISEYIAKDSELNFFIEVDIADLALTCEFKIFRITEG